MTTLELYRKHKSGEVSREKFLYEVRRDNNLPFITNLTSYDDAVKILKNKGIVTEVETKEAKADEAVKAEVKAKKPSEKKLDILHIDQANPYEYRHGLQYELAELGEYTDEALEKAKTTVLKNLAKDINFYSNLLNAEKSPYTFKQTETDAPGMQAKADGYLKKEVKKDEKSNVQDSLGKKEEGSKKPKGVKVMPDKGVTGSEKTIKEGLEEAKKNKYITFETDEDGETYPSFDDKAVADYLKSVIDPEEIENVDTFMFDDSEGWEETVINGVDSDAYETMSEKDVEELAKQEMSYYLFSKPDEFPIKENIEESSEKSDWTVGEEIVGSEKRYFLYNQETGKRKGTYKSKEEAESNINEHHNDPTFPGGSKIHAMLDKVADEWGKDSDVYNDLEDAIVGWSNRNGELSPKGILAIKNLLSNWDMLDDYEEFLGEDIETDPVNGNSSAEGQFNQLMSKYDWYYEMSDDPRAYNTGSSLDQKLKSLAKTIGVDRAVELFNLKAPSDRKVTSSFFMEGKEDKHAKLKETLKKALKQELLNPKDIQAAKATGQVVNIPDADKSAQTQAKNAKINFSTYK